MDAERRFYHWNISPADLAGLNPVRARDLLVACFYEAQKDTFARAKLKLKKIAGEAEVRASVLNMIQLVFKTQGFDFDNPSKRGLTAVANELARKALAWGTPEEIVASNQKKIQAILELL